MSRGKRTGGGGSWTSLVTMLFGVVLIVVALIMLIPVLLDYKKADDTYQKLNEEFLSVVGEITEVETEEDTGWWYKDVNVDLEALKEINSEIIGWIRFDKIDVISYPILYSGDNEKYLRTDIYGEESNSGCIFMEGGNNPDFNDCHTIIYGHNMKNGGMFGKLQKYKEEGFFDQNQYFTIYTGSVACRYRIFAYRDVPETDDVFTIGFAADDTFRNFINEIRRHSYISPDIAVSQNDKVVTLSTCSTDGYRFVVHAVRIDAFPYESNTSL